MIVLISHVFHRISLPSVIVKWHRISSDARCVLILVLELRHIQAPIQIVIFYGRGPCSQQGVAPHVCGEIVL